MLALSLHNIDVGKVENLLLNEKDKSVVPVGGSKRQLSSTSHLSITVPCKIFQKSSTRYNITVSPVDASIPHYYFNCIIF